MLNKRYYTLVNNRTRYFISLGFYKPLRYWYTKDYTNKPCTHISYCTKWHLQCYLYLALASSWLRIFTIYQYIYVIITVKSKNSAIIHFLFYLEMPAIHSEECSQLPHFSRFCYKSCFSMGRKFSKISGKLSKKNIPLVDHIDYCNSMLIKK